MWVGKSSVQRTITSDKSSYSFLRATELFFADYTDDCPWFILVELSCNGVIGIAAGLTFKSCSLANGILIAGMTAYLAALAYWRPIGMRLNAMQTYLFAAMQLIATVLFAIYNATGQQHKVVLDLAAFFCDAVLWLSIGRALMDLSITIYRTARSRQFRDFWLRRHQERKIPPPISLSEPRSEHPPEAEQEEELLIMAASSGAAQDNLLVEEEGGEIGAKKARTRDPIKGMVIGGPRSTRPDPHVHRAAVIEVLGKLADVAATLDEANRLSQELLLHRKQDDHSAVTTRVPISGSLSPSTPRRRGDASTSSGPRISTRNDSTFL